jgi:hypothetical protein
VALCPAVFVVGPLDGAPDEQGAQVACVGRQPEPLQLDDDLCTTSLADTPACARPSNTQAAAWYMAWRWAR